MAEKRALSIQENEQKGGERMDGENRECLSDHERAEFGSPKKASASFGVAGACQDEMR